MVKECLRYYLELSQMAPYEEWSKEAFEKNPPRSIRFQRLTAFTKFLNLKLIFEENTNKLQLRETDGLNSSVLMDRISSSPYAEQFEMSETIKLMITDAENNYERAWNDLFEDLLEMRQHLYNLNSVTDKYIAANGLYLLAIETCRSIRRETRSINVHLTKTMEYMINPEHRSYTPLELNFHFNYPLDNLDDIDLDWI